MRNLIKEKGFEYLVYALILSLFFSKAIPNIILVILSVLAIIDFKNNPILKTKFTFSSSVILLILLILLTLKSILFNTISYDLKVYRGLFLLFWIAIVFKKITDFKTLKLVLLWGINAAILSSVFLIGLFYLKNHNLPFSNTAEVN
ncbi:hypothetical protein, partial [Flavobacterium bizetiae]